MALREKDLAAFDSNSNGRKNKVANSEVDYGITQKGPESVLSGLETEKTFAPTYFTSNNDAKYDEGAIPDWIPIPVVYQTRENIRRFAIFLMFISSIIFTLFVAMIKWAVDMGFDSNEILLFRSVIQLVLTIFIMKMRGDNMKPHYNTWTFIV